MKLFKNIDEKFEDIGFKKVKEDKYGVVYERYDEKYKYKQVLDILHKASGKHIIQSYDGTNTASELFSPMVGLTGYEMKLALKKMKKLKLYSK